MSDYYLLRLNLPAELSADMRTLYSDLVRAHNKSIDESVYFDAGFDLFCPMEINVAGGSMTKIDMGVRGAMTFIKKGRSLSNPKGSALSNPKGSALSNPKGSALSNPKGSALSNPLEAEIETQLETQLETPLETPLETQLETPLETPLETQLETQLARPTASGIAAVGYFLYPRSSTGTKTPLRLANSIGIIDAGYRGNYIAAFDNIRTESFKVERLQRLVQICPPNLTYPLRVELVEDLEQTIRGTGGFGSTGK